MTWGMVGVIIAARQRGRSWMGQVGWAAPYVALTAFLSYAIPFWLKDIGRDWEDKLKFDPLSYAANMTVSVAGWNAVCISLHREKWCLKPPQPIPHTHAA